MFSKYIINIQMSAGMGADSLLAVDCSRLYCHQPSVVIFTVKINVTFVRPVCAKTN